MRLLSNRDFLRLWTGETVSVFGSQVTLLAIPLAAVLTLHAGSFQMDCSRPRACCRGSLRATGGRVDRPPPTTPADPDRSRPRARGDPPHRADRLRARRALVRPARDRRVRRRDADALLRPVLGLLSADDRPARAARRCEQQADDEHLGGADRRADILRRLVGSRRRRSRSSSTPSRSSSPPSSWRGSTPPSRSARSRRPGPGATTSRSGCASSSATVSSDRSRGARRR